MHVLEGFSSFPPPHPPSSEYLSVLLNEELPANQCHLMILEQLLLMSTHTTH